VDYRRIIPCLDTKDGKLVKGVNFVDLKDLGDPAEAGAAYSEAGADELVVLDITATLEGRQTMLKTVERVLAKISIPLTVGGGIASFQDAKRLLDLGVARVSLNTAAVRRPDVVREIVFEYGSDRVVVAIDTRTSTETKSGFEVMINGGTKGTGIDAVEWATDVTVELGAGSILPTSMDADGMQTGYDIPMTKAIADAVDVPVIASGGAGSLEHLVEAVKEGHADAVLVASIAHYGTFTIKQMKEFMAENGLAVNL